MVSFMVVVIEPGRKGIGAFVVGGEGLSVGPLGLEGAVEPLYLSVGPWTVRLMNRCWAPMAATASLNAADLR